LAVAPVVECRFAIKYELGSDLGPAISSGSDDHSGSVDNGLRYHCRSVTVSIIVHLKSRNDALTFSTNEP
jgi:hypothetical protein